jgi:protein FRA10AC1
MRWRTKDEVLSGKGQFTCASLSCSRRDDVVVDPEPDEDGDSRNERASGKRWREGGERGLQTFELNFGYVEEGIKKNALVKVRVCGRCARKLGEVQGATAREKRRSRSRSRTRRRENNPDSRRRRKKERRDRGGDLNTERRRAPPSEEGPPQRPRSRSPSPDRALSVP